MKNLLLESWKDSWTKWSQKVNAIITILPLGWASLPEDWRSSIPQTWIMIFAALGLINFIVSNLKQKNREQK